MPSFLQKLVVLIWTWPLGRLLLAIFWCWTVEHSCKMTEGKSGVSDMSYWVTKEKLDHRCREASLATASVPQIRHCSLSFKSRVGEKAIICKERQNIFQDRVKATSKICRKNCYSLKIALWDSNDSHLRPMASASELGAEREKKVLQRRLGTRNKTGFWGTYFQCSEVTECIQHPSWQPWYWGLRAGWKAQCSWGWHFRKAATGCLLTDTVWQNSSCFSCWPPQQRVQSSTV